MNLHVYVHWVRKLLCYRDLNLLIGNSLNSCDFRVDRIEVRLTGLGPSYWLLKLKLFAGSSRRVEKDRVDVRPWRRNYLVLEHCEGA